MTTWTDESYNATLSASNELLRAAHDLNEAIADQEGGATSPDDVLNALLEIREQVRLMEVRLIRERFPNAVQMPS